MQDRVVDGWLSIIQAIGQEVICYNKYNTFNMLKFTISIYFSINYIEFSILMYYTFKLTLLIISILLIILFHT